MGAKARREREIARTRQDILEAAARAFSKNGFASATMQDIAREAGYTAASLYSYFSSKDEIVRSLLETVREERRAAFTTPMPEGLTLRQRLELVMNRLLDIARRHGDLLRFFHFSGGLRMLCPGEHTHSLVQDEVRELTQFFEQAAPGELGKWTPEDAAWALGGLFHALAIRWLHSDGEVRSDAISDFLDLFFHGISGPAAQEGK